MKFSKPTPKHMCAVLNSKRALKHVMPHECRFLVEEEHDNTLIYICDAINTRLKLLSVSMFRARTLSHIQRGIDLAGTYFSRFHSESGKLTFFRQLRCNR